MPMVPIPKGTRRVRRGDERPPREWTIMLERRRLLSRRARGEVEVGYLERKYEGGWRAFPAVLAPDTDPWSDHKRFTEGCQWLVDNYKSWYATTETARAADRQELAEVKLSGHGELAASAHHADLSEARLLTEKDFPVTTTSGRQLTAADLDALAEEAEAGYDLDDLSWAAQPALPAPEEE